MNILLVDDDHFVIMALEKKVNWKYLGVDAVYTANNMTQAQQIIKSSAIHLLISDIEMPMGSGLELLSWIRYEGYNIQAIFLTNYANFNYAQKAIELQSFEYYLKPIDVDKLTLVILKAINKIKSSEYNRSLQSDSEVDRYCKERFWQYMLNQQNRLSAENLSSLMKENPSYHLDEIFLPVIITFFPYKITTDYQILSARKDKELFDERFKNIFNQEFAEFSLEVLFEYSIAKESFAAIFRIPFNHINQTISKIEKRCNLLFPELCKTLDCPIRFTIGNASPLSSFYDTLEELFNMNQNMVNCKNKLVSLQNYHPVSTKHVEFNPTYWETYLQDKDKDSFIENFKKHLKHLCSTDCINYAILNSLKIDVTQLIYSFLQKNGISAHQLFNEEISAFLSNRAVLSLEDFMNYITYYVHLSLEYLTFSTSQQSIVHTICDYIDNHYNDNLNRESIGKIVYLNPDYVARVFKNKMGISPGNYIINKRLEVAKDLLIHTKLPVNLISEKVGYCNYSYFTKLFGREIGCTPSEYRKQFSKNKQLYRV
mgnify:CR=1 FL=1